MQNVKICLIDERSKVVESSDMNFATIGNVLWAIEDNEIKYPFLSGIDPYGHTYLNVRQAPKVIEELEAFKKEKKTEPVLEEITTIIRFLKKVEQGLLAKFIGD